MKIPFSLQHFIPNFLVNYLENRKVFRDFNKFINKENEFVSVFNELSQDENPYYSALLSQYCKTNGKVCDELQKLIINKTSKVIKKKGSSRIFGDFYEEQIDNILNDLNKDGYSIYDRFLPEDICNSLYQQAELTSYITEVDKIKVEKIDFQNPRGEVCNFDRNDVLKMEWVQKLFCDSFFISIAENYFKSNVIFDFPYMWWSFPFTKRKKMDSAQYFHFDFDRIKWLKVFIYLTDVDDNNGPHCYVKGSHLAGEKPSELLERGYQRIADYEISKFYKSDDFNHFNKKTFGELYSKTIQRENELKDLGYTLITKWEDK